MDFVPLLALMALIWKLTDFLKDATSKNWNGVISQAIVWIAGVVAIVAFAASPLFGSDIMIGNFALSSMSLIEQVLVGLSLGSSASVGFDLKKAFDNTDSAKTPPLVNKP